MARVVDFEECAIRGSSSWVVGVGMRFSDYKLIDAGDTALVVQFGETIDLGVSEKIIELVSRLENANIAGIVEIVPSFRSVMIHYEPLVLASSVRTPRSGSARW